MRQPWTPVAAANGMATSVSVIPVQLAPGLQDWNISNPVEQSTKTPLSAVLNRLAERGYAQRDLERVLGLSPGYLSKLRHEKVTPSFQLDALLRLVDEAPKSTLASIARMAGLTPPRPARRQPLERPRPQKSAPSVRAPRSAALLVSLAPLFAKHRVRWALTGARALGAYGLHRSTVDVDILVHTDDRHALAIMRERGHELGFFSNEHVFCFPSRRKNPNDKLDIHFPRLPPLHDAVLHPELRSVFGAKLPVVAPLPLAAWKLMSTTAKDQADAAALISCGFVSRGAVAKLLRVLLAGPKPTDPYARRQFTPERALAALEIDG